MGSWQEMARRLAHEIKNPLTPIQLAIEEVHARYRGDDKAFHDLLDTALGVVTEEVTTSDEPVVMIVNDYEEVGSATSGFFGTAAGAVSRSPARCAAGSGQGWKIGRAHV